MKETKKNLPSLRSTRNPASPVSSPAILPSPNNHPNKQVKN